jgi:hypothetical protein
MKTLQFDSTGNMGGISRMFAIPLTSFVRLWTDHVNSLTYLHVKNRADIIDIYCNDYSTQFSEEYNNGAYQIEASGIVPKSNPVNAANLRKLESGYWFLFFEDNNGFKRFAGTEDNMLSFKRTTNTGTLGQLNQMEFTFSGQQRVECAYIELAEMDDL